MSCWRSPEDRTNAERRRRPLAPICAATLLALGCPSLAMAQAPPPYGEPAEVEPPRPFGQGKINLGLALGISTGRSTAISIGGAFGYYVLPGLEPGLQLDVTFGSEINTVTSLLPYVRWVFWRSYIVSPFVKAQGGRLFVANARDLTALGGGGGLVWFMNRNLGVQIEAVVYRLFPADVCGEDCVATDIGLSFAVYFGGAAPAPPRPAPPPPLAVPPTPVEPPAPPPPPPTPPPAPATAPAPATPAAPAQPPAPGDDL